MILVNRRLFLILILSVAAGFTGLSVLAYRILIQALSTDPQRLKILAERFFLAGILGGGFFIIIFLAAALHSLHFSRSLEKLVALSRSRGYSPVEGLRKLGRVGKQLGDIVYDMNRLSEKKSLKIGALNGLCDILVEGHEDALGVTNVKGEILYVSRKLTEGLKLNRADMTGHSLSEFLPDREIQNHIMDVFTTRLSKTLPETEITLIPVHNQKKEPAFIIFLFKKIKTDIPKPIKKPVPGKEKNSFSRRNLFGLFNRSKPNKKPAQNTGISGNGKVNPGE